MRWAPLVLLVACSGSGKDEAPDDTESEPIVETGQTSYTTQETASVPETGDTAGASPTLGEILAEAMAEASPALVPLDAAPIQDPALVALGQALFFDPLLSGNKDTSCASCHHPSFGTGDGLVLAVGTGGRGIGPDRAAPGHPDYIPRHSMSLFNMGHDSVREMFWDNRVSASAGVYITPAGPQTPSGLTSVVAAQALFPLADRNEMLGHPGDTAFDGSDNELADFADDDFTGIWEGVSARVRNEEGYEPLLTGAFPGTPVDDIEIHHLVNAIAAFQIDAFSFHETPWDEFLRGDDDAINDAQKLGAILFLAAGCNECHNGPLMTDQRAYNTLIPQLGPGKEGGFDLGQGGYRFRTPALRNVELSAPYMHNGAIGTLDEVAVHYGDPIAMSANLDTSHIPEDLLDSVVAGRAVHDEQVDLVPNDLPTEPQLAGLSNIRQFLLALTDPAARDMSGVVPASVPSGLPVTGP